MACQRGRLDIIQNIFQPGIFTNYSHLKFFTKFSDDKNLSALLREFFRSLKTYKETFDISVVLKYFKIPEDEISRNLEFLL